jgi:hypothetical protein
MVAPKKEMGPRDGLSLEELQGVIAAAVRMTARGAWLIGWAVRQAKERFFMQQNVGWMRWVAEHCRPYSYPTISRYVALSERVAWEAVCREDVSLSELYELAGITRRPVRPTAPPDAVQAETAPAVSAQALAPADGTPPMAAQPPARGIVAKEVPPAVPADDDHARLTATVPDDPDAIPEVVAGISRHVGWLSAAARTRRQRQTFWRRLGGRAGEVAAQLTQVRRQIDELLAEGPETTPAVEDAPEPVIKPRRRSRKAATP